jgi:protocatechuate 3,4-dioxygenase beta subunit
MNMLHLTTLSIGAALVLNLSIEVNAAERLQSVVRRISSPEEPTSTNAAKTIQCGGTVIDTSGKPVAGALVQCYQYGSGGTPYIGNEWEVKKEVTTDADGAFNFQVQPASTVVLGRKSGLAPAWAQFWNLTKTTTNLHLTLTPPTALTGAVVDQADKPVADAEVWVYYACIVSDREEGGMSYAYLNGKPVRDAFSAHTAADGKFVIQGFPTNASADLAVSSPGKVVREPERDGISPDNMRCQPGQRDVKLVLEPAGSVQGKVVEQETGQPLAGMRFFPQRTQRGSQVGSFGASDRKPAESGSDGTFQLHNLAPGTYDLHGTFGTNAIPEWVAEVVPITVEAGQVTRDIRVSATRGGLLEAAVFGKADHRPIAGASVYVSKQGYQGGAATGTNGLALVRLPPGHYSVSASQNNSRNEGVEAEVEAGQTNHIQIELNPPPRITGVVRDASGAPVPGLDLSVFPNWGQNSGGATTDTKGRYEMLWNPQRMGPSGSGFCLLARDVGRNLATAQDIDEGTTTLDLQLQPGLVVVGRVEDVNGKALTNATVRLYLWSGNSGSQFDNKPTKTDAQGHYEITALPPGRKFSMDATAKGYGSANQNIQEDAETNRVELPPCVLKVADHQLAGEVVDTDDKPAVRANVYMYGQGQPNGSVRTDDKGRFRFKEVCEGTVQLSASIRSSYGNARAEAGDTNVVIKLGVNQAYSVRETPKRPSLKGKALPDLAPLALGADAAPAGKPVLLCLFDIEQRPSRRFVKQLADQWDALRQQGVTVLGAQAAVTTAEAFKDWKDTNPVPFPVGRLLEKAPNTKWASDVESLPWLILTDGERRVTAEGLALDEIEAKLKSQAK